MSTRVRLPTTPPPPPELSEPELDGVVTGLAGLLICRDDADRVAERIAALEPRCEFVLVVDDGSSDDTARRAEEAGARILRIPAPRGQGRALLAGMRLARELGAIGALAPDGEILEVADFDRMALAHLRAPEALVLGVGPGQALAGKEWAEAAALAEGREPEPYPDWRPPKGDGLVGMTERWFERLVQTRFGYPWGGPRVLPLQAILRRDLREPGAGIHIELLALSVVAGIPAIELELARAPHRPVVTCRKVALRLLARFVPRAVKDRVEDRLGLSSGYAPPTTSPLQLLLAASLAVVLATGLAGCPKAPLPAAVVGCEQELPRTSWPGEGDAEAALDEIVAARSGLQTLWVEQAVEVDDPEMDGARKLRGVLALGGADRLRLRLLGPMGMTILDYVEVAGDWQLTVPPASLFRQGGPDDPVVAPEEMEVGGPPLQPELLASLIRSIQPGATVRWQDGSCAVLEEIDGDVVVRRLAFRPVDAGWEVAREEALRDGQVQLLVDFADYRPVEGDGAWPHRSEITDPGRGTRILLLTKKLRTDGITDAFFAMQEG
jgi:hypothetical protein